MTFGQKGITMSDIWTKKEAAQNALFAVNPGACNATALGRALHEVGKAYLHTDGTQAANQSAPMRLILEQICYLATGRSFLTPEEFSQAYDECTRISKENAPLHDQK